MLFRKRMLTAGRHSVRSENQAPLARSNEASASPKNPGPCGHRERASHRGPPLTENASEWADRRRGLGNKLDQFGLPRGVGLGEHFLEMRFDRGQTHTEFVCGVLRCLTAYDVLEHMAFGARQFIQFSERLGRQLRQAGWVR